MALESSTHGQLSPPHSDHEDHHFTDFNGRVAATVPYTPPPLNAAHPYAYGDPEEYEMQHHQAYFDHDAFYSERPYRTPPQPIVSGGMQTRSGRSLGTPATTGSASSRMSSSPSGQRRTKKGKDKNANYKIDKPLSEMTAEYDVPVEDMMAWVNRSNEERWEEVRNKYKNKIPRPMNSFMLYRRAFKERIKKWGAQGDNNQLISSVAGISWHLESRELREFYAKIADLERHNHAKAFPDYKFTPNKSMKKRDRDENDAEESDPEWDGGSSYSGKRRRGRSDRETTRSRSPTPAQILYSSPSYYTPLHQASNPHLIPIPQYDQWVQPVPYGQYQYDQLAYPRHPYILQHGPTSVPMQQDRYASQLVGLPPTRDRTIEMESAFPPDFAVDPNLGDYSSSISYQYGSFPNDVDDYETGRGQRSYDEHTESVDHPGLQTLAPAETGWTEGSRAGSAFDTELRKWNGEL